MKMFGDKKGIEWNYAIPFILLVVILVVSLLWFSGLKDKIYDSWGFVRNLFTFGR